MLRILCQHSVGEVQSRRCLESSRSPTFFVSAPGRPRLFLSSPPSVFFFWNIYVYISVHSEATLSIFKKQIARQVFFLLLMRHAHFTHARTLFTRASPGARGLSGGLSFCRTCRSERGEAGGKGKALVVLQRAEVLECFIRRGSSSAAISVGILRLRQLLDDSWTHILMPHPGE